MNRAYLFACLCFAAGCSQQLEVIVEPDAGSPTPDGGSGPPPHTPAHCAIAPGAGWQALGSPADVESLLPASTNAVAIHGALTAAAGANGVFVSDGASWRALSSAGLLSALPNRIASLVYFSGTWWATYDSAGGLEPNVFRYVDDATGWSPEGASSSSPAGTPVLELMVFGDRLVAFMSDGLAVYEGTATWRHLDFGPDVFVTDAVVTGTELYVSTLTMDPDTGERLVEIRRTTDTTDLATWDVVPHGTLTFLDVPVDLEAGGGTVIATPGILGTGGYYRLDRATDTFVPIVPDDGILPAWIAADGTVLAMTASRGVVIGPGLDGPWTTAPIDFPWSQTTTGLATIFLMASEGGSIVGAVELGTTSPFGVDPISGSRVLRSDDHGRSFHPASVTREPAAIHDAASDGDTLALVVAADPAVSGNGEDRVFTLDGDDAWADRSSALLGPLAIDGISGVELGDHGLFITRPATRAQTPPQASEDGGRTWGARSADYPIYSSDFSWAYRTASSYAVDDRQRLYVGTVGGPVGTCGGGKVPGSDARTGAGIWRTIGGTWVPMNAGVPIASPASPCGGAPFRADVRSIAWTDAGLLASLAGYGTYRIEGDRWYPYAVGNPLETEGFVIGAVGETAYGWGRGQLFVLDGTTWGALDAGTDLRSAAARADLLARASGEGVSVSSDLGGRWTLLPGVDHAVHLAFSRHRLYATDATNHAFAIAIECTEAM